MSVKGGAGGERELHVLADWTQSHYIHTQKHWRAQTHKGEGRGTFHTHHNLHHSALQLMGTKSPGVVSRRLLCMQMETCMWCPCTCSSTLHMHMAPPCRTPRRGRPRRPPPTAFPDILPGFGVSLPLKTSVYTHRYKLLQKLLQPLQLDSLQREQGFRLLPIPFFSLTPPLLLLTKRSMNSTLLLPPVVLLHSKPPSLRELSSAPTLKVGGGLGVGGVAATPTREAMWTSVLLAG